MPERVGHLFGPILRQYVGVTYSHTEGGLWLPVQVLVVAGLLAAYLVALVRRRGLVDFLRGRVDRRRPADLLLAVPPVVAVLWAASDATWYTGTPRYLVGTFPLLAIGLAALLPSRPRRCRPAGGRLRGAELRVLPDDPPGRPPARDAVLRQVAGVLAADGETRVYAGYWTAMPLQYVAGDRLAVATAGGVRAVPGRPGRGRARPRPGVRRQRLRRDRAAFRAALDRGRVPYRARGSRS